MRKDENPPIKVLKVILGFVSLFIGLVLTNEYNIVSLGFIFIILAFVLIVLGLKDRVMAEKRKNDRVPYSKREIKKVPLMMRKHERKKRMTLALFGVKSGPKKETKK